MNEVNQRRFVPISVVMLVLISLLGVFQVFVITGVYELESSTVKKFAPWAYEDFLKLVGEHPETRPDWAAKKIEKKEASSGVTIAGFNPEEISVTLNIDPVPATEVKFDAAESVQEPKVIVPVTNESPAQPEVKPEDIVPVG